jgi:hypothetical protein
MNHRLLTGVIVIVVLNGLFLTGCSQSPSEADVVDSEVQVQTRVAQTLAARAESNTDDEVIEEDQLEPTLLPSEIPTITSLPTDTPIPTDTLTPTPSIPQVHVDVNTNCRSGPGGIYDLKGYLLVGQQAEVVGQFADGDYWVIKNPSRPGECWLWGNYATLEGPVGQLPYFTPPPTPTPTFTLTPTFTSTPEVNWTGSWTTAYAEIGNPYITIPISLTQSGSIVYGNFTYNTIYYNLTGSLSSDLRTLTGYWDNGITTGPFLFHWLNPNQFNGNAANGSIQWCGYRNGAMIPSPCLYP